MYTKMAAHAAHICTQKVISLIYNILSILSYVCKNRNLCAKRAFCVQSQGVCAKCVQICAGCVQLEAIVCAL